MFFVLFCGTWGFLGLIFLTIGIIILKSRKNKELKCTSKTYGKVTDIVKHETRDSSGDYISSWHPVFEYSVGELKFVKESFYGGS